MGEVPAGFDFVESIGTDGARVCAAPAASPAATFDHPTPPPPPHALTFDHVAATDPLRFEAGALGEGASAAGCRCHLGTERGCIAATAASPAAAHAHPPFPSPPNAPAAPETGPRLATPTDAFRDGGQRSAVGPAVSLPPRQSGSTTVVLCSCPHFRPTTTECELCRTNRPRIP